jgi:hypothetical protein
MLHSDLLIPETLNDPAKTKQLNALIARVKNHKAMYSYYITDEPNTAAFPGLGKLVAHLRKQDPEHFAYINLFPTYANNEQLGTAGDVETAYKEYLRQFIAIVKPSLLSYDHYHFTVHGDSDQYFLNLGLIRQAAINAKIPFLNIVQACTWSNSMRAPNANEARWLSSTSLAYGALGLSYFVYFHEPFYKEFLDKAGQMMRPDGTTTALYEAAKVQLPEFVNVATQLKPLRSLCAFPVASPSQCTLPLSEIPFQLDSTEGFLIGVFGKINKPSHVYIVNLDYTQSKSTILHYRKGSEMFDASAKTWTKLADTQLTLTLLPGGGKLFRVR